MSALFGSDISSDQPKALLYSKHSSVCHSLVTSYLLYHHNTTKGSRIVNNDSFPDTINTAAIRLGTATSRKRGVGNTTQSVADNRLQKEDMAILCESAITNLISQNNNNNKDDSILRDIISSHDYIIIDEPLGIYKSTEDF